MTKAFTLIEVIVAVSLIFIIGLTLSKISSQNVNTIQSVKENQSYLHSLALNSTNDFKDINDYSSIADLPKVDYRIEKTSEILSEIPYVLHENFSITFILEKEIIKDAQAQKNYFRIK